MKAAEKFVEELVSVVQPSTRGKIVVLEVEPTASHDFNWIASMGDDGDDANTRYNSVIAELRNQHRRLNWESVAREGRWRRIANG
jgi:hypothetical protein